MTTKPPQKQPVIATGRNTAQLTSLGKERRCADEARALLCIRLHQVAQIVAAGGVLLGTAAPIKSNSMRKILWPPFALVEKNRFVEAAKGSPRGTRPLVKRRRASEVTSHTRALLIEVAEVVTR
jgi:hypothetical protein